MNNKVLNWFKAAGIRALKTVAQTMAGMMTGELVGIMDVDWMAMLSIAAMAGVASLVTSVAGLPELKVEN